MKLKISFSGNTNQCPFNLLSLKKEKLKALQFSYSSQEMHKTFGNFIDFVDLSQKHIQWIIYLEKTKSKRLREQTQGDKARAVEWQPLPPNEPAHAPLLPRWDLSRLSTEASFLRTSISVMCSGVWDARNTEEQEALHWLWCSSSVTMKLWKNINGSRWWAITTL